MITYFKLLLTAVFWGGTFVAGRSLAQNVGPYSAAFSCPSATITSESWIESDLREKTNRVGVLRAKPERPCSLDVIFARLLVQ